VHVEPLAQVALLPPVVLKIMIRKFVAASGWFAVAVMSAVSFVLSDVAVVVMLTDQGALLMAMTFDVADVEAGGAVELDVPTYAMYDRPALPHDWVGVVHVAPELHVTYRAPEATS
jgi:hypothetical protein